MRKAKLTIDLEITILKQRDQAEGMLTSVGRRLIKVIYRVNEADQSISNSPHLMLSFLEINRNQLEIIYPLLSQSEKHPLGAKGVPEAVEFQWHSWNSVKSCLI